MSDNPIHLAPQCSAVTSFPVRQRLLVVDDEVLILEGLTRLLATRDYDVVTANGGCEALIAIGKQQFDAILLDLGMPDLNGSEVLRFVSERGVDTPVIVVSGDSTIDAAIRALRGGAADFVRKPYEPEELLRRIENTLTRRRLEKENNHILQRLQQSEKWHRFLVNSSPDFIYTLDCEGRFTFVNDRVESLLGYSSEELLGQHYSLVIHEDDIARAEHIFNERRAGDRSARNIEIHLKCNPGMRRPRLMNGRCKSVELTATGMYDEDASPFEQRFIGSYGVAKDITERKQAEETVHYQAYHDLLTGLPNRALFRDHLGLMLAQARRTQQPLAVLSLDLDHFKVINDALGHAIGDELLLAVGARLRQCLREGDTLARLGGDEFAVLLPTLVSRSDVDHICRKIIQVLSKPVYVKGHEIYVSVSIGACVAPEDGDMIDSLIRQAEIAMYRAKSQGRSQLQFWEAGMQAPYSERMQIEVDLRRALARNEFVLFYQPQVDTTTGEVRGFEALLRWWHPQRGLLAPADFIPVAEECGVIVPIGDWVLRQAGAQMAEWRHAGLPPVRLSVNISARQLESSDFVDSVMRAVQIYSLDGNLLELEITETLLMRDFEANAIKLGRLSVAGVRIAIDDFGTGYSSFKYLSRFPIHTLKIDQSFVQELDREENMSIVNAMIAMGRGMNLNVVAEGVETEAQRALLQQMQCHEVQGYYYSPPVSSQAATALLGQHARGFEKHGQRVAG
ncbi:MAG: EAL domain-containing response regulator [Thiobacillus sp.]|nr:MAG: two-component system response regulator [Hydrogenophilales bacterium 16-64-40]OZA35302.1 MAG: two-component system response regulator [Hydrogenophilales bacterium 17-64-65]HQT33722.1 EAL domain-containing protein [Thiobacillus sp.]